MAAARTAGPKVFVRISVLATPPCSLFMNLVEVLDPPGPGSLPQLALDRNRKLHIYRKVGERTKLGQ